MLNSLGGLDWKELESPTISQYFKKPAQTEDPFSKLPNQTSTKSNKGSIILPNISTNGSSRNNLRNLLTNKSFASNLPSPNQKSELRLGSNSKDHLAKDKAAETGNYFWRSNLVKPLKGGHRHTQSHRSMLDQTRSSSQDNTSRSVLHNISVQDGETGKQPEDIHNADEKEWVSGIDDWIKMHSAGSGCNYADNQVRSLHDFLLSLGGGSNVKTNKFVSSGPNVNMKMMDMILRGEQKGKF